MSWARIDDHANEHRKQLRAGPEACWLWTCGLMYCNRQAARDGVIPGEVLGLLYPADSFRTKPAKLAAKLVDVGLWERIDGGYRVHNWDRWNKSSEAIEAERAKGRERAKRSFERRRGEVGSESSPEESPKTLGVFGDSSPEDTPKHNEVFTVSSGSTPLHSKKIHSGKTDPRPDPLREPVHHPEPACPPEVAIPCPPDLSLSPDALGNLAMAGIPEDLARMVTAELRAAWVGSDRRKTPQGWVDYLRASVTRSLSSAEKRSEVRGRLEAEPAKPKPEPDWREAMAERNRRQEESDARIKAEIRAELAKATPVVAAPLPTPAPARPKRVIDPKEIQANREAQLAALRAAEAAGVA